MATDDRVPDGALLLAALPILILMGVVAAIRLRDAAERRRGDGLARVRARNGAIILPPPGALAGGGNGAVPSNGTAATAIAQAPTEPAAALAVVSVPPRAFDSAPEPAPEPSREFQEVPDPERTPAPEPESEPSSEPNEAPDLEQTPAPEEAPEPQPTAALADAYTASRIKRALRPGARIEVLYSRAVPDSVGAIREVLPNRQRRIELSPWPGSKQSTILKWPPTRQVRVDSADQVSLLGREGEVQLTFRLLDGASG